MYTVYGIPNCDTVKKALDWLKSNNINYEFHDYKKKGISDDKLKAWSEQVGWEKLLNKKSATWRGLDEATQSSAVDEASAIAIMRDATSIIKRPVIEKGKNIVAVGFDEAGYKKAFKK